ncbi:hypothetical protein BOX15_Mlig002406g1 [Macrostomum lignano]|uniref:Doublecortin domain-containing protein n=1 Tax=Macrostomum lignano TaxID=282301 RepID=A0A267ECB7_9PLAT|nr:hypothetical protein BOX15_Mlig002406g2 [Macrostomum lignano]PAA60311.1 hypothetical protein BOX15_Mlig002406g1 [Macrostomum lignano]
MGTRTIDDLLLTQYIKELSTSQTIVKQCDSSPYKLPLKHTNILATHRGLLPRQSDSSQDPKDRKCNSARSRSSGPTGIQRKTRLSVAGNGLTEGESKQRTRNKSIDSEEINEADLTHGSQRRSSHSRSRRTKSSVPAYLQVPSVYVVTAFINGDRSKSARVSAPNFEKLLEQCTKKLRLSSAARKLFLSSGKEVPRTATIPRGTEIYVSVGEAFKDPAKLLEKRLNLGADVQWTLNGINLPSDREREATRPVSTPRGLSEQATRRRILIFPNGKGINGIEILANVSNLDELKYNCTLKFNFGQHIKRILLNDGVEVENIEADIPEIDPLLNNSHGTPLLGPVWASKGEDISPMGVEEYLRDVIRFVKQKRKLSRDYRSQLKLVYNSDDRESLAKDKKLTDKKILSMTDDEIQSELDKEGDKIRQYNAFLENHELMLEYVEPEAKNEQEEGSKFTMKHIRALPENHSLVSGSPGLRVIVFMNGTDSNPVNAFFNIHEASRGLKKDKNRRQIIFQRFLDSLSANSLLAHKSSKSKGILVRRVFTKTGTEITDAMTIEQEQQIWISHGEDWIDPFTYCLQAEISKVTEWKKGDRRFAIVRSEMPQIDEKTTWRAQLGVPDNIEQHLLPEPEPRNEEEEEPQEEEKLPEESVPDDGCFLTNSKNRQLCLFVEPVVGTQRQPKEAPNAGDGGDKAKHVWPVWPRAGVSQIWVVHKSGQITLKNFKIALTLVDAEIQTDLQGATMRGRLVQFTPLEEDRVPAAQKWEFGRDGLIYSQMEPGFVLTYLGGLLDEPHTRPKNELYESSLNYRNMLAACEPLSSRDDVSGKLREQLDKYQRFGLRLSKFENFSTWRKAGEGNEKSEKHKDPKWSKLALLWPTDKNGDLIEDLDWPLECHMLAFAPPLKEFKPETESPKRFFCLKNGERKEQFGVFVTAPDMTNMKKQKKQGKKKGSRKHQAASSQEETDSFVVDDYIHVPHCSEMTVQQVEFKIFLECCTNLLGLSSAARRLFDENGIEHESLEKLEKDQKLYVSVGEPWSDPKYSKQQLEARSMLVKLAEDVDKIRSFVALKQTAALVITAESLTAGSKLGVSRDLLTKRERRAKQLQESESPPDANFDSSNEDEDEEEDEGLTAHQRACRRSDAEKVRRDGLKWPWERIVNNDLDQSADDSAERQAPDPAPAKKHRQNKSLSLKQFVLEDGFISARENSNLVLTAAASPDARVLEVSLEKRAPDNLFQRWQLNNNGSIALKYRPGNVLTVKLPTVTRFSSETVDIESSMLTVQPLKAYQFGRAHQLFSVDSQRSTICCFATSALDVAVTSANQSGCCTYYVSTVKGESLDQPGYIAYLETRQQESRVKKCSVCVSCAKSLRGKYKLQKIAPGARTDFACAFGRANELGLKERGSFAVLNDKIDLAEGEDKATLKRWEDEIQVQRNKLSVKAISNRLSEAQTPRPIRVLAYRNGEGRLCKPVPVYGTSLQGIMDQCASKLRISWAVRKLYLEDGTPVLDLDDLRSWCATHAEQVRRRQKEIEEGRLQPEMDEIRDEVEKSGTPKVDPTPENSPRSPEKSVISRRDSLEPRLKQKYFVIGSNFTTPTAYTMSISLYSINFLDEILPQERLDSGDTEMIVRYSIFGQTICTDPFINEEAFEGEKREIQLKSELPILRRFFKEKFSLMKFDLVRMPEETVLATSYVPLDTLVREEHEEFVNSTKIAADYAWYKKSAAKPKGQRTHASLHVEISITVSIDIEVDNDDESGDAGELREAQAMPSEAAAPADSNTAEEAGADPAADAAESLQAESAVLKDEQPAPDPHEVVVELWASTGEAFVPLHQAHREFRKMAQQRKDLRQVLNSKDADKHILKMMQGRRLQAQEPGTFRSTTDPQNPVVVEGGWQTPKGEEVMVEREISELEGKEAKIREKHAAKQSQPRRPAFDFDRQLYRQSSMLRLRVFVNGEDPKTATTVWAETIHQVLDTATTRLGLRKPAKILFCLDGKDVHDIGQLSRDQLLCVSSGEPFQPPGSALETVEIKANWGRAKRQYGPGATNFHVQARSHPLVGVDPFGPPLHGANAKPSPPLVPIYDSRRVRVFENGRAVGEPESVFGDSLEALLAAATKRLKLRNPAVCFYNEEGHRVLSFNEISRDDLLYASTTNKGFIRPERR